MVYDITDEEIRQEIPIALYLIENGYFEGDSWTLAKQIVINKKNASRGALTPTSPITKRE
jgi:hypothetical protein